MMQSVINWFEIPASDFARACKFYEAIFAEKLNVMDVGNAKLGMFPVDWQKATGGAIAAGEGFTPCATGTKVYLSGGEDLAVVLARVEAAGGKIVCPKTQITPEYGYMAAILDTEGNWVGLHSPK